jgi:hypothetical protein
MGIGTLYRDGLVAGFGTLRHWRDIDRRCNHQRFNRKDFLRPIEPSRD